MQTVNYRGHRFLPKKEENINIWSIKWLRIQEYFSLLSAVLRISLSLIIRLKKKEKNYCQRPQRQQDVSRHLQRTTKFGVCYIHPNDRRGKNKGNER